MLSPLSSPTKEVDIDFLVFVERYATDLLRWDILTFFGHNPNFSGPIVQIAEHIGRGVSSLRPELGDLALLGILERIDTKDGLILYQLTPEPQLRQSALKFAERQSSTGRSKMMI